VGVCGGWTVGGWAGGRADKDTHVVPPLPEWRNLGKQNRDAMFCCPSRTRGLHGPDWAQTLLGKCGRGSKFPPLRGQGLEMFFGFPGIDSAHIAGVSGLVQVGGLGGRTGG
jgi:hypothetical protein